MNTLVSTDELVDNLKNPHWLIVDCRFSLADASAGQKAYDEGHIPGAVYVNLDEQLSVPHVAGKTGRHPLPARSDWINTVRNLGISPDVQVVLYDDAGGAMAGRMWWMLRWIGHDSVALLNGGIKAWQAAGQEITTELPMARAASGADYDNLPSLVKIVEADGIDGNTQLLLDARELPRFRGEVEPLDPVAGHIPGAQCSPFSGNLDAKGLFRSPEALREKFANAAASTRPVVCYCGSGVTAAHNVLAMKIAGLEDPSLYPGSWSEWITDPARPVATGD